MEEMLRAQLLSLAAAFVAAQPIGVSTLSKRIFNDNTFFSRLDRGDNFTVRSLDRALRWFSENWPAGLDWPADVPRPAIASAAEAPEAA